MSLALDDCSDGELAALALGGRQSAYTAMLARYREPVFRVVRATIGDDDDAVDVTPFPQSKSMEDDVVFVSQYVANRLGIRPGAILRMDKSYYGRTLELFTIYKYN